MAENLLYLTELVGLKVYDTRSRRIGRVRDAALVPLIDSSRVDRFLVGGGWAWLTVRYDQVRSISLDGIYLQDELLTPYHSDEYMLRLVRDLLDQQIIDVSGRKVVRVTDVTFTVSREDGRDVLRVLEVDIGLRSVLRRLCQGIIPPRWVRRIQQRIPPNSIRWEFCNIVEADPQRRLRLNISHAALEKLHPADLADIVEELGPEDREAILSAIDSEVAAETLSEVDPKMQVSILESLDAEKAADIVEEMAPDEAADLLAELEEEASAEILQEMETEPKAEIQELLEFKEDSAGGLMNTEYVALSERATVADAVTALKGNEELLESLNTIFLVDEEGRFKGAVPVARLFIYPESTELRALAGEPLIRVNVNERQKRVIELFDKYNLLALPVVDDDDRLAGVITADDVISVLREK